MSIEKSSSNPDAQNRSHDRKYPQDFYDALDRCVDLYDAFNTVVEIGKSFEPDNYKLAKDIRDYLKKKVPPRTLYRWLQPLTEEWRDKKKQRKREELMNEKPVIELPTGCDLRLGDFRDECKEIPDNSIDLIFTDPPYAIEYLPLYKDLGIVAARVLKPGGSLVTHSGQYALPKFLENLEAPGLTYNWIICVKHSGAHNVCHPSKVFIEWKPLLWFTKGEEPNTVEYTADFIQSEQPDKALDDWAQSTVEAEYIIQQHTVENQLVLDTCMGSGTTGIAALKLKRKFIGMDILEEKYNIAKSNIAKSRIYIVGFKSGLTSNVKTF